VSVSHENEEGEKIKIKRGVQNIMKKTKRKQKFRQVEKKRQPPTKKLRR